MDDERIDFTALDPWREPGRLRDASQAIVEAHRATPRRAPFHALLASLAPRALLAAALATALVWLIPTLTMRPEPKTNSVPAVEVARWVERGRVPDGYALLKLAEVSHGK